MPSATRERLHSSVAGESMRMPGNIIAASLAVLFIYLVHMLFEILHIDRPKEVKV